MVNKIIALNILGVAILLSGCLNSENLEEKLRPILKEKNLDLISVSNYNNPVKTDDEYADLVIKDPCGKTLNVKFAKVEHTIDKDTSYIILETFKDRKNVNTILTKSGFKRTKLKSTTKNEQEVEGAWACGEKFEGSIIFDENIVTDNKHQLVIKLPLK